MKVYLYKSFWHVNTVFKNMRDIGNRRGKNYKVICYRDDPKVTKIHHISSFNCIRETIILATLQC